LFLPQLSILWLGDASGRSEYDCRRRQSELQQAMHHEVAQFFKLIPPSVGIAKQYRRASAQLERSWLQ
jgi:hypothetical protein